MPDGTTVIAKDDPKSYSRTSGVQWWIPVHVEQVALPTVYFQFSTVPREKAKQVSLALQAKGYRIPGEERIDMKRGLDEVRYFYPQDKDAADKLAADVTETLRSLGYTGLPPTVSQSYTSLPSKKNRPGIIELWIDLPAS